MGKADMMLGNAERLRNRSDSSAPLAEVFFRP